MWKDVTELYTLKPAEQPTSPEILTEKSEAHEELHNLMFNMREIDRLYYDHIRQCPNCSIMLDLAMKLWKGQNHEDQNESIP